jgi:hypothetical protein
MSLRQSLIRLHFSPALAAAALGLVLAGCGSSPKRVAYDPEAFSSTDTHTRVFEATEAQTCEAARRALLSQGYLVTAANGELVTGKKAFQPAPEVHVELDFRVVCANETGSGKRKVRGTPGRTLVFVSALQDRYSLKKVNNSASVGVGVLGSVSLPYSSSDDSLVKVASQTVTDEQFYDRFFSIVQRYIVNEASMQDEPPVATAVTSSTLVAQPLPEPEAPQAQAQAPVAHAPAPAPAPASQQVQMRAPPLPVEQLGQPASMPSQAQTAGATPAAR